MRKILGIVATPVIGGLVSQSPTTVNPMDKIDVMMKKAQDDSAQKRKENHNKMMSDLMKRMTDEHAKKEDKTDKK